MANENDGLHVLVLCRMPNGQRWVATFNNYPHVPDSIYAKALRFEMPAAKVVGIVRNVPHTVKLERVTEHTEALFNGKYQPMGSNTAADKPG